MATGTWIHEGAIATTLEVLSGWTQTVGLQERRHRVGGDHCLNPWLGASALPEERLDVMEQRKYVQSLFQAQQEAESLPKTVWLLWSAVAQQLQSQQQQLEAQQREIDTLKRQLQEHPSAQAPAALDPFQHWMMNHRAEVADHRGKHIAVHPEEGIVASADNYASLVDELDRRSVPDSHVVIEFIPPTFSVK